MKGEARRPWDVRIEGGELDPSARGRFLGRFDEDDLRRELRTAGVIDALAERGYAEPEVRIEEVQGEHRLEVRPREGGETLIELRMAEGVLAVEDAALRAQGMDVLFVLAVHWLSLQDPRASFTALRPRLPGQRHPGLGLGRRLYTHVLEWAVHWGKDALVNHPEYFHNARFYAPPFFFLSAVEQGRFEALGRDLADLGVAEASAAVEERRVREEPGGRVVEWAPGAMAAPATDRLRGWFTSSEYRDAVTRAREAVRFRLVAER